jgi:hypothetical protein
MLLRGTLGALGRASTTTPPPTAQPWPSTNRQFLWDPDELSTLEVVDGRVERINDAGGNSAAYASAEGSATRRPRLVTLFRRRMMEFTGDNLLWAYGPIRGAQPLRGPRTIHAVFVMPQAAPQAEMCVISYFDWEQDYWHNAAVISGPDLSYRPAIRTIDAGFSDRSTYGGSGSLAPGQLALLTWRWNGDGTTDLFIDKTKLTRSQASAIPADSGAGVEPSAAIGIRRLDRQTVMPRLSGHLGALLRFSVARSDAEVAAAHDIMLSRYAP